MDKTFNQEQVDFAIAIVYLDTVEGEWVGRANIITHTSAFTPIHITSPVLVPSFIELSVLWLLERLMGIGRIRVLKLCGNVAKMTMRMTGR